MRVHDSESSWTRDAGGCVASPVPRCRAGRRRSTPGVGADADARTVGPGLRSGSRGERRSASSRALWAAWRGGSTCSVAARGPRRASCRTLHRAGPKVAAPSPLAMAPSGPAGAPRVWASAVGTRPTCLREKRLALSVRSVWSPTREGGGSRASSAGRAAHAAQSEACLSAGSSPFPRRAHTDVTSDPSRRPATLTPAEDDSESWPVF